MPAGNCRLQACVMLSPLLHRRKFRTFRPVEGGGGRGGGGLIRPVWATARSWDLDIAYIVQTTFGVVGFSREGRGI